MKSLVLAVAAAAVCAAPVVVSAQASPDASGPITRAQVRAELVELEQAGYSVSGEEATYPDALQAAESRVAAQKGEYSGYGGVSSGSSASGRPAGVRPASDDGMKSIYFGN